MDPKVLSLQTFTLAAKEVRQVNRMILPPLKDLPDNNESIRVWITISANQPFLSYVSTVFEDGEAGSMPFEVYPSRLMMQ